MRPSQLSGRRTTTAVAQGRCARRHTRLDRRAAAPRRARREWAWGWSADRARGPDQCRCRKAPAARTLGPANDQGCGVRTLRSSCMILWRAAARVSSEMVPLLADRINPCELQFHCNPADAKGKKAATGAAPAVHAVARTVLEYATLQASASHEGGGQWRSSRPYAACWPCANI